jgi:hypothetical protein
LIGRARREAALKRMNRMIPMGKIFSGIALAVLMTLAGLSAASASSSQTITAFSAWQGQGQIVQTGLKRATFVGSISGRLYVLTDKGPVDAGNMVCPAIVVIDLDDGKQSGTGHCAVTGSDGAQVFMDLACEGVHLVGCTGDATFTGGTDRFAGVSGGGHFVLRSSLKEIVGQANGSATETANGIIYWHDLSYQLP